MVRSSTWAYGGTKNLRFFQPKSPCISDTVRVRPAVTMDRHKHPIKQSLSMSLSDAERRDRRVQVFRQICVHMLAIKVGMLKHAWRDVINHVPTQLSAPTVWHMATTFCKMTKLGEGNFLHAHRAPIVSEDFTGSKNFVIPLRTHTFT